MSRNLRALRHGIARAIRSIARHPAATCAVIGAVAVMFLLIGLAHLAERSVAAATSSWRGAHMVVYLEQDTPAARADEIRAALASLPAVERSVYVSPDEALGRLRGVLDEHDELVAGLEASMMPASIEVTLHAGVDAMATAHPVVDRLEATPGVEEVEFAGQWVRSATSLMSGLRTASWAFLALVALACAYLVTIIISARVAGHRPEAEVLELLGASSAFVRGPLILEGAIQGAIGASLAIAGLWALFQGLAKPAHEALRAALGAAPVAFLPAQHMAVLVAAGALLGAACSWAAARRHALG